MRALTLLLGLSFSYQGFAACAFEFRHWRTFDPPELVADYKDSVGHVVVGSDPADTSTHRYLGIAFLVDEVDGVYLTAGHVVDSVAAEDLLIVHKNRLIPPARLKIALQSSDPDIAVLRIEDDNATLPLGLAPLGNLSFGLPREGSQFFAFGGGWIDQQRHIRGEPAAFTNWADDHKRMMQVNTVIVSGDSGGPLVDSNGVVIGVFKAKTGPVPVSPTGEFTPLYLTESLLFGLSPNSEAERLLQVLYDNRLDRRSMAAQLEKMSNLELLTLVGAMSEQLESYDHVRPLIRCPLFTALIHRGMQVAAERISPLLASADHARVKVAVADRYEETGSTDEAKEALLAAQTLFTDAVAEARESDNETYLAYLYLDQANSEYRLSRLVGDNAKDRVSYMAQAAVNYERAAALHAPIATVAYPVIGDMLNEAGRPGDALHWYSRALQSGMNTPAWVSANKNAVAAKLDENAIRAAEARQKMDIGEVVKQVGSMAETF